ncbi:MAG: hypothetical protein KBS43_03655 [Oscillospiraceae bacterium]|nr:hypothetical protein [Candidatus Limimonas coprohippi]
MKRFIAFVMTLVMVLALTGCHKNEPTIEPEYADGPNASGVDLSVFEGKQLKPYVEMIASNNFYYQKTDSNGDSVTFTRIGSDEKVSVAGGASFIKKGDGKIYYVQGNYYCELTSSFVATSGIQASYEDIKTVLATYEALVMGMLQLVPVDVNASLNLEGYTHEEYKDIENNRAYSFFFDSTGTLASVLEVSGSDNNYSYDVTMGVPSANAISNIFENGTLVDDQTAIEGAASQTTKAPTPTQAPTQAPAENAN